MAAIAADDRGAAGHVVLHLVHVLGRLDRDAAGVERDALADQPEHDVRAPRSAGSCRRTMQPRRLVAARARRRAAGPSSARRSASRRGPRRCRPAAVADAPRARSANTRGVSALPGSLASARAWLRGTRRGSRRARRAVGQRARRRRRRAARRRSSHSGIVVGGLVAARRRSWPMHDAFGHACAACAGGHRRAGAGRSTATRVRRCCRAASPPMMATRRRTSGGERPPAPGADQHHARRSPAGPTAEDASVSYELAVRTPRARARGQRPRRRGLSRPGSSAKSSSLEDGNDEQVGVESRRGSRRRARTAASDEPSASV